MNVEYWLICWPVYFLVKLQPGKHNFPSIYYTPEAIEQFYMPEISVIQFSNLYYDDRVVNKKTVHSLSFHYKKSFFLRFHSRVLYERWGKIIIGYLAPLNKQPS